MNYYLGVDGGGTKTIAVIGDEDGHLLGWGTGGPSNAHFCLPQTALQSIQDSIQRARAQAGDKPVSRAALCVPGLKHHFDPVEIAVALAITPEAPQITGDDVSTFYGALGHAYGIVVLAGTGSFALGMDCHGKRVSVGGWGPLLGDEGSGFAIGQAALKAVICEYEARGPSTVLTGLIKSHFALNDLFDLRSRIYQSSSYQNVISGIAPLVLEAVQAGDRMAQVIIHDAGTALGKLAVVVLRQIDFDLDTDTVVLTGGIRNLGDWILAPFEQEIHKHAESIRIRPPRFIPAVGALMLALEADGRTIDAAMLDTFQQELKES